MTWSRRHHRGGAGSSPRSSTCPPPPDSCSPRPCPPSSPSADRRPARELGLADPVVVGTLLALMGLWIRRGAAETRGPVGEADQQGLFEAIRRYPRQTVLLCGVTLTGTIAYYSWTTYLPTYTQQHGVATARALLVSTISLLFAVIPPVLGTLSDRIGRKPMLIASAGISAFGIVPALSVIRGGASFGGLLAVTVLGMVVVGSFTSISAAVNAELIPAHVRAAGISVSLLTDRDGLRGHRPLHTHPVRQLGSPRVVRLVRGCPVGGLVDRLVLLPETFWKEPD